ncbi:hypothetical protein KAFR_0C01910 [Kazachstania africana CBS 2517]|uniref:STAS domain-containing protein n=1 Tax=Kazachstania africana (strain ATCC 22294 / BCRC 22015 / CBS 2517 / CECT 1963 / NBRC 1671 / NRRL Y-8276) TaxID=1071382 RepID=H2AS34_KAZAF|nr:hypothetical protein KAFR_0C01910 [Kazachstania africana CBS 2517]CCF57184.1 hypothetical protein KAFR_0C01910 [Kazachstania africana CBS 2517]
MTSFNKSNDARASKRLSLSDSISRSLGLQDQESNIAGTDNELSNSKSNYLSRSYMYGLLPSATPVEELETNTLPLSNDLRNKSIHQSRILHKQTAAICEDFNESDEGSMKDYLDFIENTDRDNINEHKESLPVTVVLSTPADEVEEQDESSRLLLTPSSSNAEVSSIAEGLRHHYSSIESTKDNNMPIEEQQDNTINEKLSTFFYNTLQYFPASVLGLLLNILDALSYGMIIFPISEPIFSHLGPTGMSMFYISTIICQFIYSSGWSSFPSCIGSEMIEITPFFHTMAFAIMRSLPGEENQDAIITTTIFCYVISSMFTGLTFLTLGKLRLGKIVGFFPRHILIGCIGGVGYFLLITGIEVTTRIAKFEYSLPLIKELFTDTSMLWKWLTPTLLTVVLILTQKCFKRSLVLPSFYIATLILFHFIVAIIPRLSLTQLREAGWIFSNTAPNSAWYDHYKLFDFHKVHWLLVFKQIPTMLALTFFGILHVPINVPALAMSVQMDKYDVDKELIAHGLSNLVSGMFGSIQNYLVYTNSVLFIRAGADSPFAGYLLIFLTIVVMLIGPVIISFIPICIVGSLIFLLGYELLVEALLDTWDKLTTFEYVTVVVIVLTMGIVDFVLGIIVGILIACFKFLIDSSKLQTINGEFSGKVAKSTVNRDLIQSKFLNGIGDQIYVLKLQNLLFFGTIISIEEKIDKLLEMSDRNSSKRQIKYLILDFRNINADNIDYSAAEGFNRIKRLTESKNIQLIISSIKVRDRIYNSFNKVGLLVGVELFNDLNGALEWCENEFLYQYKMIRERIKIKNVKTATHSSDGNLSKPSAMTLSINTPRNYQIYSVAQNIFKNEEQTVDRLKNRFQDQTPVLPLLLFALKQYRPDIVSVDKVKKGKEIEFWSQLAPYFSKKRIASQSILYHGNNIFFLVEIGVLKVTFDLPQGKVYETMSKRACYGKIMGKIPVSEADAPSSQAMIIKTEADTVIWIIDSSALKKMKDENIELYLELVLLVMTIKDIRFKSLLGHALVST